MRLKTTLLALCALVGLGAWAGIPNGVGFAGRSATGVHDEAWEIFFDNNLLSHSKHGILNNLQWTCTGATTHSEGTTTPAGQYMTRNSAFVAVADGGDVVFTSPYDFNAQKGWSGNNFKYVAITAIVTNPEGVTSVFQPKFKFLAFSDRSDPAENVRVPANDITFSFDEMPSGLNQQTVWSNTREYAGGGVLCRQFQVVFPDLQAGSVVKLLAVGLYCSYGNEKHLVVAPESKISVDWFNYDLGAHGQSYWGFESSSPNVNETDYPLAIRVGKDSVVMVAALGTQTIEGLPITGRPSYDKQSNWGDPNYFRNGKNTLTNEEALKTFGQWYDYTIEVTEPCYANLNLVIGGHYDGWYNVANGWGGNGDNILSLSEMPGTVWPRRYCYSYVVAVDGKNVSVADNYKKYPTFYKKVIPPGGSLDASQKYTADEFLALLDNPDQWINLPATEASVDTLHLWPSNIYSGNEWVPFSSAEKHPALGDQYVNIPLNVGKHTFRIKKLTGANDNFAGFIFKTSASVNAVQSVTLNPIGINKLSGTAQTISYSVSPATADNTAITWSCDNPDVEIIDNGDGTATVSYKGTVEVSNVTITAAAADGFGASASLLVKQCTVSAANYPLATPIAAGVAQNNWTFIAATINSDLTSNSIEGNRITTPWTVTGAKEVQANASSNHRSWAGAIAQGGDVTFATEQEDFYNAADGSPLYAYLSVITNNQNGSNSVFEPLLRLTNKSTGEVATLRLGTTNSSINRQQLTAYDPSVAIANRKFNKIEVIFPDLDENSLVSLTAIQFGLGGSRTLNPSSSVIIPSHFYDQGGNGVGYWSYIDRDHWDVFWRRVDADSVNLGGGFQTKNLTAEMEAFGADAGIAYGHIENCHGVGGWGSTPANVNGGLTNDANSDNPWTHEQAANYYGAWYNYTVNVPNNVYASINIATAQRWVYCQSMINGNGDHGIVLTPEGNKMIWSRRYAGGAYVLSVNGENVKTNQKSYPSLLADQSKIYGNKGPGGSDCLDKESFKAVINDPTQWTSTLMPDGTPNDTLFCWPNIIASDNDYHVNFYVDKMVNPDAGDQWTLVPLKAGKNTIRIQNVFGLKQILGTIEIKSGAAAVAVTQLRLRAQSSTIDELVEGEPVEMQYQIVPNTATNKNLIITCSNDEVKVANSGVDSRGIGTLTFSYEPAAQAAGAPARAAAPLRSSGETTITIAPEDAFSEAEPITVTVGAVVTGVEQLNADKAVEKVTYYNALGVASDEPFQGVNVVVTNYSDGSKSTRKVVK